DTEARWVKKGGQSMFGYKQHTLVDDNGLVSATETTAANEHDSKPMFWHYLIKLRSKQARGCMVRRSIVVRSTMKL
ncbi:Transposase DDE domain-containing protein, partial [Nitrosomonas aestuarii]